MISHTHRQGITVHQHGERLQPALHALQSALTEGEVARQPQVREHPHL